MMRLWKLTACTVVFGGFIGVSLLVRIALFLASSAIRKRVVIRLVQITTRLLLRVLCVTIHQPARLPSLPPQGCFIVSNHQSYLDILMLATYFPAQFIAKKELGAWPLIGWMAKLGHCIFIDRESTRHSLQCVHEITAALQQGRHVLVFPEGTSTNGTIVLPFKSLLFCAAHKAGSPVLPLTLNYLAINGQPLNEQTRDLCCWYGEMNFVSHFWQVLALRRIEVFLEAHPMFNPPHHITASELAQRAHEKVAQRFTTASATASTSSEPLDAPGEFLLGAVLMSLVNHETFTFEEGDYGEA